MKVIVTGGAGFIGANLCRELAARPQVDQVVAVDDLSTGYAANLHGTDAKLIEGSILDEDLMASAIEDADAVVHLAARPSVPKSLLDPVASHRANASGTVQVLEACRPRSVHVITASSSSVYGTTAACPKHEDLPTRPLSPYGASKLAAEAYTLAHAASYDLPVLAFRFFNVFGPLQPAGHAYAAVVPAFIDAILRREPMRVHGDGHQTRDFTYVGSVTRVLADAVVRKVTSPEPVNLAFGTRMSVLELAERLRRIVDAPLDIEHLPSRPGDIRDSQADPARLRRLFPNVEPVPVDTGLVRTVDWFRSLPQHAGGHVPEKAGDAGGR